MMSTLLQLNYMIFQEINAHAGTISWLDALMVFCADSLIFYWPLLLLALWGRPLNWRKKPLSTDEVETLRERRAIVVWVGFACVLSYGLNLLIEQFTFEPRPFASHKVHLLIAHTADSGFPSDHTAWSFAVVGMLLFTFLPLFVGDHHARFSSRLVPLLFIGGSLVIAGSIGIARIFVGVHYPGDVLAGALDGIIIAYIVTILRRRLDRPTDAVLNIARRLRLA